MAARSITISRVLPAPFGPSSTIRSPLPELLAGPEQQPAVWRLDRGIIQRDQNLGMRSAIGKPDRPRGSLEVRRLCRIFQLLGALLQLLGLRQKGGAADNTSPAAGRG